MPETIRRPQAAFGADSKVAGARLAYFESGVGEWYALAAQDADTGIFGAA